MVKKCSGWNSSLNKVYGYFSLQVAVEATVEHPFYAIGHGWSSSSPNRSLAKFQLPCHQVHP